MKIDEAIEELKDSMYDTEARRMAISALEIQRWKTMKDLEKWDDGSELPKE